MVGVNVAVETSETMITGTIIKIAVQAVVRQKETFQITGEEVKTIHLEDDEDNGMVTTPIILIETIGTDSSMARTMPIEAEDGKVIEVKETVIGGEGENGIPIRNTSNMDIHNSPITLILTTIAPAYGPSIISVPHTI